MENLTQLMKNLTIAVASKLFDMYVDRIKIAKNCRIINFKKSHCLIREKFIYL